MRRELTDGARGTGTGAGAGAVTTLPANKPRVSRAALRLVGWDISFAGLLPVLSVGIYTHSTCTSHSGNLHCTQPARYYTVWLVSFR